MTDSSLGIWLGLVIGIGFLLVVAFVAGIIASAWLGDERMK